MMTTIEKHLGDKASSLLNFKNPKIAKERLHLPGGHVGAVVSRKAATTLWPQLSTWWRTHDHAAASSAA